MQNFFLITIALLLLGSMSCNDDEEFIGCPCSGGDQAPIYRGCGYMSDCGESHECGQKEMLEKVYSTIRYPAEARENDIQGTIIVEFEIDIFGKPQNCRVRSDTLGYGIPEAAIEGVKALSEPGFYPARLDCEPVDFTFVFPIKFKLQ